MSAMSPTPWSAASTMGRLRAVPMNSADRKSIPSARWSNCSRADPPETDVDRNPVRARRLAGAAHVDPAEPAVDAGPGRDAEARQCRVVGRAYPGGARYHADAGRGDPAELSRPLPPWRLVRARTRGLIQRSVAGHR